MAVKAGMTSSRVSNFMLREQVPPPVATVTGEQAMSSSLDAERVTVAFVYFFFCIPFFGLFFIFSSERFTVGFFYNKALITNK
jgi:hypothetical protein